MQQETYLNPGMDRKLGGNAPASGTGPINGGIESMSAAINWRSLKARE